MTTTVTDPRPWGSGRPIPDNLIKTKRGTGDIIDYNIAEKGSEESKRQ